MIVVMPLSDAFQALGDALYEPHFVWDFVRVVTAACALWLSILILRLGWYRRKHPVTGNPHIATYLSYAFGLVVIAVFRFSRLGEAPDKRMWIALIIVGLGMFGVLRRVNLGQPFKRGR